MATPTFGNDKYSAAATWTGETGTGGSVDFSRFPNSRTVQRFGGTGTVTIEGSNDNTNWFALNNTANPSAAVSLATGTTTAMGLLETTRWLRVVVAGGTATVSIVGYQD